MAQNTLIYLFWTGLAGVVISRQGFDIWVANTWKMPNWHAVLLSYSKTAYLYFTDDMGFEIFFSCELSLILDIQMLKNIFEN